MTSGGGDRRLLSTSHLASLASSVPMSTPANAPGLCHGWGVPCEGQEPWSEPRGLPGLCPGAVRPCEGRSGCCRDCRGCCSHVLCSAALVSGWESQLLETGFLGIFLCPLWTLSPLPRGTPTSRIVLWGFRWLIFRIMLGAVS